MLKGRRTEVEYINGLVSRKGQEAGIATPVNDLATELVQRLERGQLQPAPDNIRLLQDRTG